MVEAPRVLLVSPSSLVAGNYRTIYFTSATPSQQIAAMLMDTVLGKIFFKSINHILSIILKSFKSRISVQVSNKCRGYGRPRPPRPPVQPRLAFSERKVPGRQMFSFPFQSLNLNMLWPPGILKEQFTNIWIRFYQGFSQIFNKRHIFI